MNDNKHHYKRMQLEFGGDIAMTPAEGLITLRSDGKWSSTDIAIHLAAGDRYHQAAQTYLNQLGRSPRQCETIAVDGDRFPRSGNFRFVIFVIDNDLEVPLYRLVHAGLVSAYQHGLVSVSMPLMRTDVMAGTVEKILAEAMQQMMLGIKQFVDQYPSYGLRIAIAFYDDRNGSIRHQLQIQAQAELR